MRRFAAAGLALFILFASCAAAAQDVPAHLSADPQTNRARLLIQRGDYQGALDILRALPPSHSQSQDARFLRGFAAVNLANEKDSDAAEELLSEAVAAFRSMLIENPALIRVRLELARAFFLKGEDELAEKHFRYVLAGDIPAVMAANVGRYLQSIRARRRWRGFVSFALAPDSNINSAPDVDIVRIGRLPFLLSEDARESSGVGFIVRGGGSREWPVNARWRLFVGGDILRREHKGGNFDEMTLSAKGGAQYKTLSATEFSFAPVISRRWVGNAPHSYDVGASAGARRDIGRRLSLASELSFRSRRHRVGGAADGHHPALEFAVSYLPSPIVRTQLFWGAAKARTKSAANRNRARFARIVADTFWKGGAVVGASFLWRETRWETGNLFIPSAAARRDTVRALSLNFSHRGFAPAGFSPRLSLTHERGDSNSPVNVYRANRAELNFVREF